MTKILLSDKIFYRWIFFPGEITNEFSPTNTFCPQTFLSEEYFSLDGFKLLCSFFVLFYEKKPYRNWKKYNNLPILGCFTVFLPLISLKIFQYLMAKKFRRQKVKKILASDESFCRWIFFYRQNFPPNFYR